MLAVCGLAASRSHPHAFPLAGTVGAAIYYGESGEEIFRWNHAWVRVGEEVNDGNVDSICENPLVPKLVRVAPYWGPITEVPGDRRLREQHGALPPDQDVEEIWWPELRAWVDPNCWTRARGMRNRAGSRT